MEVTGIVKVIGETQVISEKFKKRDIVITLDPTGKYPQFVQMQVTQDNCSKLDGISVGDEVRAQFNIKGREYNGTKGIQYFTTLEIWRIEKIGSSQGAANANPSFSTGGCNGNDNDDLPF